MATKQTRLTPFGRKVRKRLIDKNMTQVELAALLGCNKQYMDKLFDELFIHPFIGGGHRDEQNNNEQK